MRVNKNRLFPVLACLSTGLFASPAVADVATVDLVAMINTESSLVIEADGWCDDNDRFEVREFTVAENGDYGFSDLNVVPSGASIFVQINQDPRPQLFPTINIDTFDGGFPGEAEEQGFLEAGVQYYLVAVTACWDVSQETQGPVSINVTLSGDGAIDIDPGVTTSPLQPREALPVPIFNRWGLLILALMMLAGSALASRRQSLSLN